VIFIFVFAESCTIAVQVV